MKITTADCVTAIVAEAEQQLPNSVMARAPQWRRLSRTGKEGEPVIRTFSSSQAPFVKAIVQEQHGSLQVTFAQRHIWELPEDSDVDWYEMEQALYQPEIQALQAPQPQDFRFGVGVGDWLPEDSHKPTAVFVQPRVCESWDQHLGDVVAQLLPGCSPQDPADEICESTFHVDMEDPLAVKAAMIEMGFIHDPTLDNCMGS